MPMVKFLKLVPLNNSDSLCSERYWEALHFFSYGYSIQHLPTCFTIMYLGDF